MMSKNRTWLLVLTSLVIVAPIGYGLAQYDALPATMATHWGLNNQVNGWMPKPMMVFGLPLLMLVMQWVVLGATWYSARHGQAAPKLERLTAWLLPLVTVVAYVMTVRSNLGQQVDARFWALLLVAAIFIGMGNYLPTAPVEGGRWFGYGYHAPWQINNYAGAKRALRVLGYTMVIGGIAVLLSLFFAPVVSMVIVMVIVVVMLVLSLVSIKWTR